MTGVQTCALPIFLEIIIAPDFTPEALEILERKKNIRLMKLDTTLEPSNTKKYTNVNDGLLVQDMDVKSVTADELECVTDRKPTEEELRQLLFGWKVVKHVKSNAIVLVKDDMVCSRLRNRRGSSSYLSCRRCGCSSASAGAAPGAAES